MPQTEPMPQMPQWNNASFQTAPPTPPASVPALKGEIERLAREIEACGIQPHLVILGPREHALIQAALEREARWYERLWWRMQDAWDVTGMELRQWLVRRGR